jgi:L-fuconate dehydratase
VVSNGHYVLPSNPGYSAELHEESIQRYEFRTGSYWLDRSAKEVLVSR